MIRLLQPWHENIGKRQVKAPKLFLRDNGLFHTLLGIDDRDALLRHPKLGASWEGFALEETMRAVDSLRLDRLTVMYPGDRKIRLAEGIEAIGPGIE